MLDPSLAVPPHTVVHGRRSSAGDYESTAAAAAADSVQDASCGRATSLLSHVPIVSRVLLWRQQHAEYVAYQNSLPVRTVVPEPPHTLREYLSALLCGALRRVALTLFLFFASPFLLIAHLLLTLLDRRQRARWARYQRDWPHHSVPHVRPVRYAADAEFPLEQWHLRCEDGRQRWYHGAPLLDAETGNELGLAEVYGYESVAELRAATGYGDAGGAGALGGLSRVNSFTSEMSSAAPSHSGEPSAPAAPADGLARTSAACPPVPRGGGGGVALPPLSQAEKSVLTQKLQQREFVEKYQLGTTPAAPRKPRATSEEAMNAGVSFLLKLQDPFSGHWPNDYSGCMFLTPGLIFMKFITGHGDLTKMFPPCRRHHHAAVPTGASASSLSTWATDEAVRSAYIGGHGRVAAAMATAGGGEASAAREATPCRCGEATRRELIRYLRNYQNCDGGFGQHTEGHSTMLGTVLSYVSLRLLGVPADDPQASAAREWILAEGGAVSTPMWGRMWLCILGLYGYEGMPPLPPELLLLPRWVPFSEGRAWCHSRVIAMPFSYFYGLRWSAPAHPLLEALKSELFVAPFRSIAWRSYRHVVCPKDLYTPTSFLFKLACRALDVVESHHWTFLRRYALELNWAQMAYDDENTHFICLGPVNKSLNMLVTWIREGDKSVRYQLHRQRVDDYLYMGPAGMRMNGYNGSQLWDTSFAVQAICACRQEAAYPQEMALAQHYVDVAQVQSDPIAAEAFFRHRTKGAWNFSTSPQGWQVSDCTAEGLRVILLLRHLPFPRQRIFDAADEILSLRNASGDGGWASYEPTRAPYYTELMNCAEMFKDVMTEYSYAECSSSCIHSLALFRDRFPQYRRRDVDVAISEGIACVLSKQRADGSFYGSWAVCFTYGAWIVADALRVSEELGDMANHPHCVKLVNFLLEHQNSDGGWGEDINSCVRQVWVDNPDGSQVVNTAWAVMAIMNAAGDSKRTSLPRRLRVLSSVERGVRLIMSRQLADGDWAQERISGVFNGNNPIHYPGYKNSMTVWALGRYNTWKLSYLS